MEIGFDKNNIKNILIIKIAAIGDLLLITPAVRMIKQNFPNAKITLLVGSWARPIIEGNHNLDEIVEVPDQIFFGFKPISLLKTILALRRKRFDMVFVWHRALPFRIFAWLLNIKIRVGFSRQGNGSFLTHYVEENHKIHEILEYQITLRPIGIESSAIDMDLALSPADEAFALKLWRENSWSAAEIVIAIAPGGAKNPKETMPLRHWPSEYYGQLIIKLLENSAIRIVLLGGRDDVPIVAEVLKEIKNQAKIINLAAKTSLKQLAAVIKRSQLFIGNDSAPMHIAAAVKTTSLTLFGPTDPMEKAPINYRHKYFYKPPACAPCYKDGKFPKCKTKDCLRQISVNEVFAAAAELLSLK